MSRRAWSPAPRSWSCSRRVGARGWPILEGWRFEEFGRDALDLVEGRLAFAIREGKLIMTRTESEPVA